MNIEFVKIYKSLHTWTGIIAGLLLYICFIAGSVTMFAGPLDQWTFNQDKVLPAIAEDAYDSLIKKVLQAHPEAANGFTVHLPNAYPQSAPIEWTTEDELSHLKVNWQASLDDNNQLITQQLTHADAGSFIDEIHRTAGIPGEIGHEAFGTLFMGVIAGLYFVALISGLIIFLPNWFKDLFSFRNTKNRKRFWLDFHNILSISALPFHLVIAFSTFVFAFHDPIYDSLRTWVYQDTPMFSRPPASSAENNINNLASIASFKASLQELEPEYELAQLNYFRLNGPAPLVRTGGMMHGEITRGAEYVYANGNPFTGIIDYPHMLPSHMNSYSKIVSSVFSLHFGSFGGDFVRWVYFILGILGAMVFLTGNILWIESRQKKPKKNETHPQQKKSTKLMASLTSGVASGTVLALIVVLLVSKLFTTPDIVTWQYSIYYLCLFGSVIWAFKRPPMAAARDILLLTSVILAAFLIAVIVNVTNIQQLEISTPVFVCLSLAGTLALVKILSRKLIGSSGSVWTN